jgi:hypothetical protein
VVQEQQQYEEEDDDDDIYGPDLMLPPNDNHGDFAVAADQPLSISRSPRQRTGMSGSGVNRYVRSASRSGGRSNFLRATPAGIQKRRDDRGRADMTVRVSSDSNTCLYQRAYGK